MELKICENRFRVLPNVAITYRMWKELDRSNTHVIIHYASYGLYHHLCKIEDFYEYIVCTSRKQVCDMNYYNYRCQQAQQLGNLT